MTESHLHVLLRGEEGQLQVVPPAVLMALALGGRLPVVGPGVGVEGVLADVEAGVGGGGLKSGESLKRQP